MNKQLKDAWVKALRSGEYKQGRLRLHRRDGSHCCLGVLCDVSEKIGFCKAERSESGYLCGYGLSHQPFEIREQITDHHMHLIDMNDTGKLFPAIANWIETNIPEEA